MTPMAVARFERLFARLAECTSGRLSEFAEHASAVCCAEWNSSMNENNSPDLIQNIIKKEDGVVIGNVDDKYEHGNPIARHLMRGFFATLDDLVSQTKERDIIEVGCGEGHLARHLHGQGYAVRGCDFSTEIIAEAKRLSGSAGPRFEVKSIYELDPAADAAPVVMCCEVMEHLEEPETAMRRLAAIAQRWCIMSVPREPLWRALNMVRGKYLSDFGNTPGHLQHWSKRGFIELVGRHFDVVTVRSPLPWTFVLCRPK